MRKERADSVVTTPPPDSKDELEELQDLHEKGILTDQEFEAACKRLYL